jgi:transposase
MRLKIPQLREALASRFQIEHHGVMVTQLLAHIDTLDAAIENLTERTEFVLAPHAPTVELLRTIPGVQAHAAQVLIAECGLDMTPFPTVGHFASWAGACPGHHESAGRRRSGRTRPGPRWLTDQLTECARAAVRTKGTYLAAHYAQLRGRRGEPKAIGAIRHDLLVAYYHIVRDKSHSGNSARTGNASATPSSTAPAGSGASLKRSATPSRSKRPKRSNRPPDNHTTRAARPSPR